MLEELPIFSRNYAIPKVQLTNTGNAAERNVIGKYTEKKTSSWFSYLTRIKDKQ